MSKSSGHDDPAEPFHPGSASPPPRHAEGRALAPPLIFGEVLFDQFPDGRRILGGAPFNVAWNLRGLGFQPYFVSGIGDDDEGRRVIERMREWGLETSGLQTVADRPTGAVQVTLDQGQPEYEIVGNQAYDHVAPLVAVDRDRFGLLYHGSLAYRSEATRQSLQHLISHSGLPRFVDINIREPHFRRAWLPSLLRGATWIKLNDVELGELSGIETETQQGIERGVGEMKEQHGDATYFITCGSRGAYGIAGDTIEFAEAPRPDPMKDTVGAGDAFASAAIAGALSNKPLPATLAAAVRFAARVCGLTGATSTDKSIYQHVFTDG